MLLMQVISLRRIGFVKGTSRLGACPMALNSARTIEFLEATNSPRQKHNDIEMKMGFAVVVRDVLVSQHQIEPNQGSSATPRILFWWSTVVVLGPPLVLTLGGLSCKGCVCAGWSRFGALSNHEYPPDVTNADRVALVPFLTVMRSPSTLRHQYIRTPDSSTRRRKLYQP